MIITKMDYMVPVYRGPWRGENYEFVYVRVHEIKPEERRELEGITKQWTYVAGIFGRHRHSSNGVLCSYEGVSNMVHFLQWDGKTHILINGPYATEIGLEIEKLPSVIFLPSKDDVVSYDLESRV